MRILSRAFFLSFVFLAFVLLTFGGGASVQAHPSVGSDLAHGLVFDGLQAAGRGPCKGGYQFQVTLDGRSKTFCTAGPSTPRDNRDVRIRVQPLPFDVRGASAVVCDGDGVSGNRVQVLYAHSSDAPDQYAAYLSSFQAWVAGIDDIYVNSAAQTGGVRHVRFVTDANCNPVIQDVTLSPTGMSTLGYMSQELQAMGYNRWDRKYLVFADANVYCGVGMMAFDDRATPDNANNSGNMVARVDSGCWSSWATAHELMHMLGGVQASAPHADGTSHCTDGYDNMCDHSGLQVTMPLACPDVAWDDIMDCNHDDYFSTNPPAGGYLATHWNSANNVFLIAPQAAPVVRVDSLQTGKADRKGGFVATDMFKRGDTVYVRAHVVDQSGAVIGNASVTLPVKRPDGVIQCTVTASTDSNGYALGKCNLPRQAPSGPWNAHLAQLSKSGATSDLADSVKDDQFLVQ